MKAKKLRRKLKGWLEAERAAIVSDAVDAALRAGQVCTQVDTGVLHYLGGPEMPHRHTPRGIVEVKREVAA